MSDLHVHLILSIAFSIFSLVSSFERGDLNYLERQLASNKAFIHSHLCHKLNQAECKCPVPLGMNLTIPCPKFRDSPERHKLKVVEELNAHLTNDVCRRHCAVMCFCNRCWFRNDCCWANVVNPHRYTVSDTYNCLFDIAKLKIRNEKLNRKRRSLEKGMQCGKEVCGAEGCPLAADLCMDRCYQDPPFVDDPRKLREAIDKGRNQCHKCYGGCCRPSQDDFYVRYCCDMNG